MENMGIFITLHLTAYFLESIYLFILNDLASRLNLFSNSPTFSRLLIKYLFRASWQHGNLLDLETRASLD